MKMHTFVMHTAAVARVLGLVAPAARGMGRVPSRGLLTRSARASRYGGGASRYGAAHLRAAPRSLGRTATFAMALSSAGAADVCASPDLGKLRKDYAPPAWEIASVGLDFDIVDGATAEDKATTVKATMALARASGGALELDGGSTLELVSLTVDGAALAEGPDGYAFTADGGLTVAAAALPNAAHTLETVVKVAPEANTALAGLYKSGPMFCTQCEAEGFRRITYYPDRPDVMSVFSVRMAADKAKYPVLLSNGNMIEAGDEKADPTRHYAVWEDPFKKPSYLFALVAGDLGHIEDNFVTTSGRDVKLQVWSEHENVDQLDHAMVSLQKSMKWDQDRFGLEYDLDLYNIVAVNDFNMGAMENKGLNVFNTALTLAKPSTATDANYQRIESVIGHEYFHNWSGNRVTCRDWFQLTLKEGLTVFRDQEFSAAMGSAAVVRIENVRMLRARQFPEDAGPLAHPIRPEAYKAIDNFYTATIYEKGAEVIRMYQTLFGVDGFRKGVDLYFKRHDGTAVSCDDFRSAMADANGAPDGLAQFERWYTQSGTPTVTASGSYDAAKGTYTLSLAQSSLDTPGQPAAGKGAYQIPVVVGLLDAETGAEVLGSTLVVMTEAKHTFELDASKAGPKGVVPSLLRDFSAPVRLVQEPAADDATLAFLAAHDTDAFNRWEAGQQLGARVVLAAAKAAAAGAAADDLPAPPAAHVGAFKATLTDAALDKSLVAYALTLPDLSSLSDALALDGPVDPMALHGARKHVKKALGTACLSELEAAYAALAPALPEFSLSGDEVGRRALRGVVLSYIGAADAERGAELAAAQFESADCMTDKMGAFSELASSTVESPAKAAAVAAFYDEAAGDALVVNKWFGVLSGEGKVLSGVKALMDHPDFTLANPNRARSVLGVFPANWPLFHAEDGSGYAFMGEMIVTLDATNPQVASRLCGCFAQWSRFDAARSAQMKAQLEMIKAAEGLSTDTLETATRSLG